MSRRPGSALAPRPQHAGADARPHRTAMFDLPWEEGVRP